MSTIVHDIVNEFVSEIKKIYGKSLSRVILYGSYARGDYTEYSDVDVMILVSLPEEGIKKTVDIVSDRAFDFMMKYGVEISPIIKNIDQFIYWVDTLTFYRNVRDEGVILSA